MFVVLVICLAVLLSSSANFHSAALHRKRGGTGQSEVIDACTCHELSSIVMHHVHFGSTLNCVCLCSVLFDNH